MVSYEQRIRELERKIKKKDDAIERNLDILARNPSKKYDINRRIEKQRREIARLESEKGVVSEREMEDVASEVALSRKKSEKAMWKEDKDIIVKEAHLAAEKTFEGEALAERAERQRKEQGRKIKEVQEKAGGRLQARDQRHAKLRAKIAGIRRGRMRKERVTKPSSIGEKVGGTVGGIFDALKGKLSEPAKPKIKEVGGVDVAGEQRREREREKVVYKELGEAGEVSEKPAEAKVEKKGILGIGRTAKYEETLGEERARARARGEWRWLSPYWRSWFRFIFKSVIFLAAIILSIVFFGWNWLLILLIAVTVIVYFIWGLKPAAIVFGIGLLILFLYSTAFGGIIRERVWAIAGPTASRIGIGVRQKVLGIKRSIEGVGKWRNPYVEEAEEKKGVIIKEIIRRPFYKSGEDISIIGTGVIKALKDPAQVYFGCSIGDKKGKVKESDEFMDIVAGVDRPFSVECIIESSESFGKSENVKFSAIYTGYKTKGKLKLWTMPKSELESLYEAGINPFEKYGEIYNSLIRFDKLLRVDKDTRLTTSSYSYGPLILSLSVPYPQPLVEKEYTLSIGVDNDKLGWGGKLAKEKSEYYGKIILKLPTDNVESGCEEIDLKKEQESYTEYCDFEITSVEEGLSFMQIEAELIYDYEFSEKKGVTIASVGWKGLQLDSSIMYLKKGDKLTINDKEYLVLKAWLSEDKSIFNVELSTKTYRVRSNLLIRDLSSDITKAERPT